MRIRSLSPRAQAVLRDIVGPDRDLPTIGMIAASTGYSRSYISYLLNGRRNGTIEVALAVAGYLGVSVDKLLGALRKPRPSPVKRRPRGVTGALLRLRAKKNR